MQFSLLEKIGGALLICAWVIYGSHFMGEALVHVDMTHSASAAHGGGGEAEQAEKAAEEPEVDFAMLLASAEPSDGEKVFGKCKACHSIEAGGAHKVGPNLHNVVGADIAAKDGFDYSGALTGLEGQWGYDELAAYLEDPKGYAPGTKMSFGGLSKPDQRAEVIAYLRENTENPPPLPEPEEPEAAPGGETEEAPAEDAQAAAAPQESGEEAASESEQPEGEQAEGEQAEGKQAASGDAEEAAAAGESADEAANEDAGEGGSELAALLASGDAAAGEKVFRKCKACHTVEQGGANRVGPNLWGVVGKAKASAEGFNYSDALSDMGGEWTYEDLAAYLEDPRGFAPGNRMSFAGLRKAEDRANVILYLRENSDSPPPLP